MQTVEEGFDISHRYDKGPLPLFLPDVNWVARAADRQAWRSLVPQFVALVLAALRVPVPDPDLRPTRGALRQPSTASADPLPEGAGFSTCK